MNKWLMLVLRRDIVTRSGKVALLVGTILVTINYGDKLITGNILAAEWIKMILTYCVPYCVSSYASVTAILSAR